MIINVIYDGRYSLCDHLLIANTLMIQADLHAQFNTLVIRDNRHAGTRLVVVVGICFLIVAVEDADGRFWRFQGHR